MKRTLISLATSLVVFLIAIPCPCFANPQNSFSSEESVNTDAIMQSDSTSATIGQEMGHDKKLTDELHYINSNLFDMDYEIFRMNRTLIINMVLLISLYVCFALATAFLIIPLYLNLRWILKKEAERMTEDAEKLEELKIRKEELENTQRKIEELHRIIGER